MGSRRKIGARCVLCKMRKEICLCEEIASCKGRLSISTTISILMHHREVHGTTNTARLAKLTIPACEIVLRGKQGEVLDARKILIPDTQALLLYPTEDAEELSVEYVKKMNKPLHLLVPDGSWRQASKVSKREAFLKDIPRVKISSSVPSRYRLRREPKAEGLATFEAISRALGVIEGPAVQAALDALFDLMVTRTLKSRGTLERENAPLTL